MPEGLLSKAVLGPERNGILRFLSGRRRRAAEAAIEQQKAFTGYQAACAFLANDGANPAKAYMKALQTASLTVSLSFWKRARYRCGVTPSRRTKARRKLYTVPNPHRFATAWAGNSVSSI